MIGGEREVVAEVPGEGEQANHADDHQNDQANQAAKAKEQPFGAITDRHPGQAGDRFAGDGDIRAFLEIIALYEENQDGRDDQKGAQRRAHRQVPGADDLGVGFGGQHVVVAADQHRVAEIGQAVDADKQKRAGDAGSSQFQRDGPEQVPAPGPQILRRQLQVGADGFQNTGNGDICKRKKGDRLHHPQAEPAVQVGLQTQDVPGDDAPPAEQHDEG